MTRVTLPGNLSLSRLVFGLMRIGDDEDPSPARLQRKIETCLEQGITTLDQADIYGGYTAEAMLGATLRAAPQLRDQVEIVTKCGIVAPVGRHRSSRVKHYDTSPAHVRASVEASLRDMHVERIDLLLVHRPDPMIDPDQTGAVLDALVDEGKVRAVGVSNFRPWDFDLLQSRMQVRLATNQIELNLMVRGAFVEGDIAHLMLHRVPPMAWSPLGGGTLFAASPAPLRARLHEIGQAASVDMAAVAVAWLLAHPARIIPVMGTNDLDRLAHLSDAFRVQMDRQTWFELYSLAQGHEVP